MSGSETGSIVPIAQDTTSHHSHSFADRIDITEVFASHALGQNDRLGMGENTGRIALNQRQPDYSEETRIDEGNSFEELSVANRHRHWLRKQVGRCFHFGYFFLHRSQRGKWGRGQWPRGPAGQVKCQLEPIEIRAARDPSVVGEFVAQKQDDENCASEANGKPDDIDETIKLVLNEITRGRDEVVTEQGSGAHTTLRWDSLTRCSPPDRREAKLFIAQRNYGTGASNSNGVSNNRHPRNR